MNKIKFEPYGGLVGQGFSKFNETLINNQEDPHSQIENDETPEAYNLAFFESFFNLLKFSLLHFSLQSMLLFTYKYFHPFV